MSNEKGSFSADISQRAIDEALKSVEKHERASAAPEATAEPPVLEVVAQNEPEESAEPPAAVEEANAEVESLKAQLELSQAKGREMLEKVKEAHERMLRAAADLDNFKKRAQREREEAQRFGVEKLLKDFLPVMDNLERALDHAQQSQDLPALLKGVQMTRKQFEDALAKHGVKGFSALGQLFDPRVHEAMQQQERTDVPANQVILEMARGYFLHERLIRPAMVVVSAAPAAQPAPPPEREEVKDEDGGAEANGVAEDGKSDVKEGAA